MWLPKDSLGHETGCGHRSYHPVRGFSDFFFEPHSLQSHADHSGTEGRQRTCTPTLLPVTQGAYEVSLFRNVVLSGHLRTSKHDARTQTSEKFCDSLTYTSLGLFNMFLLFGLNKNYYCIAPCIFKSKFKYQVRFNLPYIFEALYH